MIFNTNASYFAYNQTTLTSKPIDARNASNVYVSFNYKVESQYTTGATDTPYVEVSNDLSATQWNVASFYKAITLSQTYAAQRVDLTPYVAGKEVYVRFRFSVKSKSIYILSGQCGFHNIYY